MRGVVERVAFLRFPAQILPKGKKEENVGTAPDIRHILLGGTDAGKEPSTPFAKLFAFTTRPSGRIYISSSSPDQSGLRY